MFDNSHWKQLQWSFLSNPAIYTFQIEISIEQENLFLNAKELFLIHGTNLNFEEPSRPSRQTPLVKKGMASYQETYA
jgi:hypothetical protein